jgi:hypothetical protein
MIYDYTKGKSAIYFSTLLKVDYDFDFNEYFLNQEELEFDNIGFYQKSAKNGFMRLGIFLPEYNEVKFGKNPVLHIYNCDTTDDISRRMKVTTTSQNTFFSRDRNKNIKANLEICKKCTRNLRKKFDLRLGLNTFSNFVLALEETDKRQLITNSDGYIINWKQVSYCYRDTKNFICEKCGYKAKEINEQKFLHTHHIDGIKTNNKRNNLQCLCVKCHSEVDEFHRAKFSFEGLSQLQEFLMHSDKK